MSQTDTTRVSNISMPFGRFRERFWRICRRYLHRCLTFYDRLRARLIYRKYSDFTMISRRSYVEELVLVATGMRWRPLRAGAIVECGTWKGGMSAGLIEICGKSMQYYFFDSFEGLPVAEDIDGEAAKTWQANTEDAGYHDNCTASLEEFRQAIDRTGCPEENLHVYQGWFEDTLKEYPPTPISILRLDADWYGSTVTCLEMLWPHVVPGGLIIIDDYYTWDGCSKAVHDFLSKTKTSERISCTPHRRAYIVKSPAEADASHPLMPLSPFLRGFSNHLNT